MLFTAVEPLDDEDDDKDRRAANVGQGCRCRSAAVALVKARLNILSNAVYFPVTLLDGLEPKIIEQTRRSHSGD